MATSSDTLPESERQHRPMKPKEKISFVLTSSEEESLPDPNNDKFLLSLLHDGEIKEDQVYQLGVHLGVESYDVDQVMRTRSDTATQALEVCHLWKKKYPEQSGNKKTARRILKTALEKCGLTRYAKSFISKTRTKTYIDELKSPIVLEKLSSIIKNEEQLLLFASTLGYDDVDTIVAISYHNSSRVSPMMKAYAVFKTWKSNSPEPDATMVEELERAYTAVTSLDKEVEVEVEETGGIAPIPVVQQQPDDEITLLHTSTESTLYKSTDGSVTTHTKKARSNKGVTFSWKGLCCCGLLAILIALVLLLVITAFSVPSYKHDISLILPGDIVRVSLPNWRPPNVEIELIGQNDGCEGKIAATEDHYIQTSVNTLEDPSRNYTYLPKESNVTISPKDVTEKINIWLFSSYRLAKEAVESRFPQDTFSCSHPPKGAQCGRIDPGSKPLVFHIHETSYYFLRCDDIFVNCTHLNHWTYHQVVYNYSEAEIHSISNTTIQSQEGHVTLHLRRPFFPPPLIKTKKATILVQLDPASCGSHDNKYFLSVTYITLYQEIAVYLAVGTVGMAILGGAFVVGRLFGCKCCKKRENVETDPLLEADT